MSQIKQKLVESIQKRLEDEVSKQNPVKFLKDLKVEDWIDGAISIVFLFTRIKKNSSKKAILMTEVITTIGHYIRNKYKLKRDSGLAAKTGAFVLYSFQELDMLIAHLGAAGNGHATYILTLTNEELLGELWDNIEENKTEKLPAFERYAPWLSTRHETGALLVKTSNEFVLKTLTSETHPLVFNVVNKAQEIGWCINKDVLAISQHALESKCAAFSDIWTQVSAEAKRTKEREARTIFSMASRFRDKVFYHLYYLDFRGRKYPATAYLHEQGSDFARGLLLREEEKAIGLEGFKWLCVSIANNWAGKSHIGELKTDKIPLADRVTWTLDNEEKILEWATAPFDNTEWMEGENPWQLIAACFELKKFREWQVSFFNNGEGFKEGYIEDALEELNIDPYGYESSLEVFIDGSTNGAQHLTALTKDEVTADYVNLVARTLPGDLYSYVGEHVWHTIGEYVKELCDEDRTVIEEFIDTLLQMKESYTEKNEKEQRELIAEIQTFKNENLILFENAAPYFWNRITDKKERRKIIKRNTMTLPYGGSAYGLGRQIIDDSKKHNIKLLISLEPKWGSFMGRLVHEDCQESLKRPMQLLKLFEAAGKKAENEGRFLTWHVPITNFPVVQNYVEGTVKKIHVAYGPHSGAKNSSGYSDNDMQLNICHLELPTPSKRKQSQGASPNAIHSLDAAHLMLTVSRCDFGVTTIHDSYGCLLADMDKLFLNVRETFIELYGAEPLEAILTDIGVSLSEVELGTLDIANIRESEYAFA